MVFGPAHTRGEGVCGAKAHNKDTAHARDNPKHAHEREVALALLPELLVQRFLFGVDARLLGALLGLARAEHTVEGDVARGARRRCSAVEVDRCRICLGCCGFGGKRGLQGSHSAHSQRRA